MADPRDDSIFDQVIHCPDEDLDTLDEEFPDDEDE